jgi:hypothetical protein
VKPEKKKKKKKKKEIIAVYSENDAKPINTTCSITDCQSRWLI